MLNPILPRLRAAAQAVTQDSCKRETAPTYKQELLRAIDIFRDLREADLCLLEAKTRMITARRGQTVYRQDETARELFLLKQGKVRLSRTSLNGRRLDLSVLGPGTFFGEMPLLGERMRNASAEAMTDCVICIMSQADVEWLILNMPQVALRLLEVLAERLAASEARLEDLAYRGVPARLASLLLRLASEADGAIEGITHQEIGETIGAYRETITKTLDEFQASGFVAVGRRRIRVLDQHGLTKILQEQ